MSLIFVCMSMYFTLFLVKNILMLLMKSNFCFYYILWFFPRCNMYFVNAICTLSNKGYLIGFRKFVIDFVLYTEERLLSSQQMMLLYLILLCFSKVLYLSVVFVRSQKMQYVCQSNHEKVSLNPCFRPQLTNSRRLTLKAR